MHKDINYIRRIDLENLNHHIVIINILASKRFCIVNLCRSFGPQGGNSPEAFFIAQQIVRIELPNLSGTLQASKILESEHVAHTKMHCKYNNS